MIEPAQRELDGFAALLSAPAETALSSRLRFCGMNALMTRERRGQSKPRQVLTSSMKPLSKQRFV